MTTAHFLNLEKSINELKRIYLPTLASTLLPSYEEQELARAFVAFAHAEMEYYVEEALKELVDVTLTAAAIGKFSSATMAMLTFGNLDKQASGTTFLKPRTVSTRIGVARSNLRTVIKNNHGVRQANLCKMTVPLGLSKDKVDSVWLGDLETFCTARGMYVHVSRLAGASPHTVNPNDLWNKCEHLIWSGTGASAGAINSFKSFDTWIENEIAAFGSLVTNKSIRIRLISIATDILARLIYRRKKQPEIEDDD